ncbi:MAG: peptide chain release factor 3 [Aristaeellaceae bacterium]
MLPANDTQAFRDMLHEQVRKRRTFAIISHPDAGKTTLTEKLLLYGGAIRSAGSVKARKSDKHATSDWMEIEKQRGISVTSSAMQFEYKPQKVQPFPGSGEEPVPIPEEGFRINILDTPGHQDFSEDTYRVLVAADAAVMLIDAAKGVEAQTIKLFKVCRMRNIPIFTFVNKMDRAAKDPFALMEELEQVLGIRSCPINWPIGVDGDFQGVYHRDTQTITLYSGGDHGAKRVDELEISLDDEALPHVLAQHYIDRLQEEILLLDEAGDAFDLDKVRRGELTPMFFGSAVTNFGVEPFLDRFLQYTNPPLPRMSDQGEVGPESPYFSGFIFKIQANMNPAHRDRLAFMRIVSGAFEKGMEVWHSGTNKPVALKQPQQFMADAREGVDEAWAGDIIGLFDPGIYQLGDTLSTGPKFHYENIPVFAPEHFSRVRPLDSMKRKQFQKGITQLAEEGAIQTFIRTETGREEFMVGVVGVLQFEVLEHRLKTEYQVEIVMEPMPFRHVRWVVKTPKEIDKLKLTSTSGRAKDSRERDVLLFENEWSIRLACENNEGLELAETANRL